MTVSRGRRVHSEQNHATKTFEDVLRFRKVFVGGDLNFVAFVIHVPKGEILDIWERTSHLLA